MSTYHVEIPGTFTLAKQSKAIEAEEALGTKFLASKIWVNAKNAVTNLAEFQELDEAPDPPLGVPSLSATLPAGKTPVWAGAMIVQGSAVQVYLLR